MATAAANAAVILIGVNDVSAYLQEASINRSTVLQDTTTFGDSAHEYTATLKGQGDIAMSGFYDSVVTTVEAYFNTFHAATTATVISYAPIAPTVGTECWFGAYWLPRYGFKQTTATVVDITGQAKASGPIDYGLVTHPLQAATGTADYASINNGAASTTGYAMVIHVTVDDFTSATVKHQDSANDVAWADLAAFAALTTTTSEIVTGTGTVRQYIRASVTAFVGTSMTFFTAFARR